MKKLEDYLREAERKKKPKDSEGEAKPTKERDPFSAFDNLFTPKQDQPLANRPDEPARDEPQGNAPQHDPRNRASQRDTQRAAGNINNPRMGDLLSRMRDIEADPDDAGYPEPDQDNQIAHRVDNRNLPAVAGQALQAGGVQEPDFHKVANLPGNMSRGIRTLGRHLFRGLTRTPTDDIWMIANLGGQGPNTRQEVNAVANWVRNHGDDLGDGNIDFDATIPGYNADIRQYSAAGIRWLLVNDEFGNYIYSWPEQDSVDARNTRELGNVPNRPRLGNR
jgi:hypothetical protein